MILALTTAFAHHGTATAQLAPVPRASAAESDATVAVTASSIGFLATREGRRPARSVGQVGVHLLTTQGDLPLGKGWTLGGAVPVGLLVADGAAHAHLGDVSASLGRAGSRLAGTVTLTAPTGSQVDHAPLSSTAMQADADGLLMTYDTRASLGQGAPTIGLRGDARIGQTWGVDLGGSASTPWLRTRDGILWGPTVQGWANAGITGGAQTLWAGLLTTMHGSDRGAFVDEAGQIERKAGSRVELVAQVGSTLTLGSKHHLRLEAGLPVWRWVQGVQLAAGPRAAVTWMRRFP